ncbi:MAG: hypothetical protein WHX52_22945 [Anaerolineae bacterium]
MRVRRWGRLRTFAVIRPQPLQFGDTPVQAGQRQQVEIAAGQRKRVRVDVRGRNGRDALTVQIRQRRQVIRATAARVVERNRHGQAVRRPQGQATLKDFADQPHGKRRMPGQAVEHPSAGVVGVVTALGGKKVRHRYLKAKLKHRAERTKPLRG